MAVETAPPPTFAPIPLDGAEQNPIKELSNSPAAVRARELRARQRAGKAGRKPGRPRKAASSSRTVRSLAPEIGAFLTLINGIVVVSPLGTRPVEAITDPTIPADRIGDELDAVEIGALASSIDAQCRRSPRFRKYVEAVLGAGSGGTLITVLALIAARRMSRHGILPANVDVMGGYILSADVETLAGMAPAPETHDAETGETVPDRGGVEDDG